MGFRIRPKSPFDLALTAGIFGRFRGEAVDIFEGSAYRRVLDVAGKQSLIWVKSTGTVDEPELHVSIYPQDLRRVRDAIRAKISYMLGADLDVLSFYVAVAGDPVLPEICGQLYGLRPTRTETLYEALVIAVTEQQISLAAATRIRGGIVRHYGKRVHFQGRDYYAFPSPASMARVNLLDLRRLGLSPKKAECILGLSRAVQSGELDLDRLSRMGTHEITEALTCLRGIGRWTAEYAVARGLGRPDALPAGDAALKRVLSSLYFRGRAVSEQRVRTLSKRWGDFPGWAAFYLLCHEMLM